ncbi:MAG: Yip1 family protein [Anaerolineae bacterium]
MDFAAMFQTWMNVITKPGEATFEAERHKPQANLTTALIWIVIAAVVLAIGNAISALISSLIGGGGSTMQMLLDQADLPPEVAAQLSASAAGGAGSIVGAFCAALILAPIFFLIGSGIYFLIAKLFGGAGAFEEQTYLLAAIAAPITIVSGVVGIIPFLGGCVAFLLTIYQLVLNYFAVKVTHNLTSGKALAVVLIPVAIFFLCLCLGVAGFVAIVGSAINEAR